MEVKGLKEAISVLKELDRGYVTRAKIRAINRVAKRVVSVSVRSAAAWWWPETTDGRVFPSER